MTAAELIANVRREDGRPYRMTEPPLVFVITGNIKLAAKLIELGGHPFRPPYLATHEYGPHGGYARERGGKLNWDIYIHTIPVEGEETIWEAVGPPNVTVPQARHISAEASAV